MLNYYSQDLNNKEIKEIVISVQLTNTYRPSE